MQTHPVELIAGPSRLPGRPLPAASKLPAAHAPENVTIQLVELPIGIPRPEVVSPAAKHGIQFRDDLLHIFPALPRIGQLSYPVPNLLGSLR